MKRLVDIIGAVLGIALLSPILIAIAIAVGFSGKGGIIYRQKRIGLHGRPFWINKFRSMIPNADKLGGYSTNAGDLRVTKLGRFLRRSSLDELPQLLNVVLGDMSLIGPRPDVPEQKALYTNEEWRIRHTVRPGITGLAQAVMRSEASVDERKRLDIKYINNQSFKLDVYIILLTLKQVLVKGGK